ncbi:MAG: hypothetical protein WBY44_15365 [Bryobacteraceae bacterium]
MHSLSAASVRSKSPGLIVVGFLGGFVGRDNPIHLEVQLAKRLNQDAGSGFLVRMFENRRGADAYREIVHLLDINEDGKLSAEEKKDGRIAIFGHSWGASETVTLARTLARVGIPVLLTVQVDSVRKPGEDDTVIPANVAQAVNFYQREGFLRGEDEIRAADSARTQILGNFECEYKTKPVALDGFSWFARTFMKPHLEIESDPTVWSRVESMIRSKLPSDAPPR